MADTKGIRTDRDPTTNNPNHPVGTGAGAVAGGAAGAVGGAAVGGPVGAVIGGVAGAVAGGAAGKGLAEAINPTVEDNYWRENFKTRSYYVEGDAYELYQPAYRYGWETYPRYVGRNFDEVEPELRTGWDRVKGTSSLTWDRAKQATRDAWHKIERAIPGDFDKDGY
jgi:hypothetical protein